MSEASPDFNFLSLEEFCFLNVLKPKGITSFDVIHKLRKRLNMKKIGHAGTLDPLAEGVMQVGVGKAARLLEYLPSDKTYIATVKFGFSSSTLDSEGEIGAADSPDFDYAELQEVLKEFTGKIKQTPPLYSAVKVCGKKLCDLARKNAKKGKETDIEIPTREVEIYSIKILTPENAPSEMLFNELKLEISCSKGTYIRTLCDDIAKRLGTRAYLTALTRTVAGSFKIENSIKIEEVSLKRDGIEPSRAVNSLKYELEPWEVQKVLNGSRIECRRPFSKDEISDGEEIILIYHNNLVSIAVLEDNKFKIKKVFKTE